MRPNLLPLLTALFVGCTTSAPGTFHGVPEHLGPGCIESICLDTDTAPSMSDFVDQYGNGYVSGTKTRFHCYTYDGQFAYVADAVSDPNEIVQIMISDVPLCTQAETFRHVFAFTTGEHLHLGDPVARVWKLYGKPSTIAVSDNLELVGPVGHSTNLGARVFIYGTRSPDDLFSARIYLRDDKVCAISISTNE